MNLISSQKNLHRTVCLLLGLLALFAIPSKTMGQSLVVVSAGDFSIDGGSTVDVPIIVRTGSQSVAALTGALIYDASVATITDCTISSGLFGSCNDANAGTIKFSVISFAGFNGETTIATASFQADGLVGESTDLALSVTTLSDAAGNPVAFSLENGRLTINVPEPPNQEPTLNVVGDQVNVVGDSVNVTLDASDPDDDTLTYSATGLPEGIAINSTNGTMTGRLVSAGSTTVELSVSDGNGGSDSTSFTWMVESVEPPTSCGPLAQEAEDGIVRGSFEQGASIDASGGHYVAAPNRSGDAPAGPDGVNEVAYCVTVPEDGIYRIAATTASANAGSNSFYVLVDGQPANGYLWSTPINSSFNRSYVGDRGGANPVEIQLAAGEHELIFALREDGTHIDNFALEAVEAVEPPPSSCVGLSREAEEGMLNGNFVVAADGAASGGQYVTAPSGNRYDGPDALQKVDYCFTVAEEGDYYIKGIVNTPSRASNSFYVKVGGAPAAGFKWNMPVNTGYEELYVGDISGANRYVVPLTAGEHTVSIFLREAGSRLDTLTLEAVNVDPPAPITCDGLSREAESGVLSGGFVVASDPAASNGQYVAVPNGAGNEYGGLNDARRIDLCFTVEEAGDFALNATVYGKNSSDNSFYIRVDNAPTAGYKWNIPINTTYKSDYVSSPESDPLVVALAAGEHTVSIFLRENGTRLDSMTLEPAISEANSRSQDDDEDDARATALGISGTVLVQSPVLAGTVDPDTIDFEEFNLSLVDTDTNGQEYAASTSPDQNGYYQFEELAVGEYTLIFMPPVGYESTMPTSTSLIVDSEQARRVAPDVIQLADSPTSDALDTVNQGRVFIPFMSRRNFKSSVSGESINWACWLDSVLLHSSEADAHPIMNAIQQTCGQ